MKRKRREALEGWLCVLPVLAVVLLIRGVPMVETIIKSFTKWDGVTASTFTGLKNYAYLLRNEEFRISLSNNFWFLLHIPVKVFIALVFACCIYENIPGTRFFRSTSYVPQVISASILGYLFCILFGYDGPINSVLRFVGLNNLAIDWLGTRWSAILVVSFCITWQSIGYVALLILGGMSSIPTEVFEAAKLDGANYWQKLFHIVLPLIARTIEFIFITNVTWVFTGLFSFVYSLTSGGPGYDTSTLDYMVYNRAFLSGNKMGLASAIAVFLVLIVAVFTFVQMGASNRREDW